MTLDGVRYCPVDGCGNLADVWIVVRWSIFDWREDASCWEHLAFTRRWWMRTLVDGLPPEAIEVNLIETVSSSSPSD